MKLLKMKISDHFSEDANVVFYKGDVSELLKTIPKETIQLIVTSPPYNLGKEYEKKQDIERYVKEQKIIIDACIPLLRPEGSICWQVGNYVTSKAEVIPLDILLYDIFKSNGLSLRNRIIWHFGHGLHTRRRFSGRYETILWFTKGDNYHFDLDAVRVKQKYPGKRAFKGPNAGKYSGHPDGKNPSDVWDIPNVKANHIEKTDHPCQFPIGLVQPLIRALTRKNDWVMDPFLGTGTTACAAILDERRAIGAEYFAKYQRIAEKRINEALQNTLKYRPYDRPIYIPKEGSKLTQRGENIADK